jgi:uncharacterized protein
LRSATSSIRIDSHTAVEMRDGTILRADIYRPDDNQKHPAILTRTPYNKQLMADNDIDLWRTVGAGFALVFQDIRGRYASEGKYFSGDKFFSAEGPDGYDTVEWIAGQKWCDGNVGTAGGSYNGRLQWILAQENPPHLRAIAPWVTSSTPTSQATFWYGVISFIMGASSAITMGLGLAEKLENEGKDASRMRQMLNQALRNPEEIYNYLPLSDIPLFNFAGLHDIWLARGLSAMPGIEDASRAVWDYQRVKVPCFQLSGWYEFNSRGAFHSFQNMRQNGGSILAREGQHLLLGPWAHSQYLGSLGDINSGALADSEGSQLCEYNIAFYNKYLRGMDINLPAVRYFVMGRNTWQNAESWPLPQTRWRRFFFHSHGQANSGKGDGILSCDEPASEPPDKYIYNPLQPVPTVGGSWAYGNGYVAGPLDQYRIEQREDILCYTTPALKDDVEVSGPLELHLFAATSARDTDFTAKLVDVYPDGRSINVADGIIRARYRKSVFTPELVTPGDVIEYTIDLIATSQLFRNGHRIRVDITSSNFPAFDRNMNTGHSNGEDITGINAEQTIYHRNGFASYIDLPVIENSLGDSSITKA